MQKKHLMKITNFLIPLFSISHLFWLHWVFVAFAWALSVCSEWRVLALAVRGFPIAVASFVEEL